MIPSIFVPLDLLFFAPAEPTDVHNPAIAVDVAEDGKTMTGHLLLPQPFWDGLKVRIINMDSQKPSPPVSIEAVISSEVYPAGRAGMLRAIAREGWTTMGRDWTFARLAGQGRFVGVIQSMTYDHYCEGDEHFFLDGSKTPALLGTGSEDYYLCCYWPNNDVLFPFGGHVSNPVEIAKRRNDEINHADHIRFYHVPSCYYRFHFDAAINFYNGADLLIQHGGISDMHSRYRSIAFSYSTNTPALRQTDLLDVGNGPSESAHEYQATASSVGSLGSEYEGDDEKQWIVDDGRNHTGGEITFRVAIGPEQRRRPPPPPTGPALQPANGDRLCRWRNRRTVVHPAVQQVPSLGRCRH